MSNRNKFLYICADCGKGTFYHKYAMTRRIKPHCTECGSTFLEIAAESARDKVATGHDAFIADLKIKTKPLDFEG